MNDIKLNYQQQQALESIVKFVDGDSDCFILSGSAGTGKTTLIRNIVIQLKAKRRICHLLAPTGRASRILHQKTSEAASTVHAAIYSMKHLAVDENATDPDSPGYADSNDPAHRFYFPLKKEDPANAIFIVDESSMVGDLENKNDLIHFGSGKLLSDFISYARMGRLGKPSGEGAKVIFIGDSAQLPPVGQKNSPALSAEYLKNKFRLQSENFELTEVMRQEKGGEILDRATTLRDSIFQKQFNCFSIKGTGDEVKAISTSMAINVVVDSFQNRIPAALVTYTNRQALKLNRSVRMRLYGDETLPVQEGDILLINKNSWRHSLYNGDLIKVINLNPKPEIKEIPMKGVEQPVTLSFRRIEYAYRDLNGAIIKSQAMILENLLESRHRELSPAESRALLVDFRVRHKHLKPRTALFVEELRCDEYFNALQVKYGYALTCHKAQGGEWDTVVVNFSGSRGSRNEEYFRWAYTAITRAKKQLFTIAAPEFDEMSDMDWGEIPVDNNTLVPIEQGDKQPVTDPDWFRFSFTSDQRNLFNYFQKLREKLAEAGVEIINIVHHQYLERYLISSGGKQATIQFWYKRDGSISRIEHLPLVGEDANLGTKMIQVFHASLCANSSKSGVTEDIFIRKFREKITSSIAQDNVRIVSTELRDYCYRIEFESDNNRSKIDFHFNGKHKWTKVNEVGGIGSSMGLKEKLQKLIQK